MAHLKMIAANSNHLQEILQIESRANPSPWSHESFEHEFDNPNGTFWVAILESNVVGYGGIWFAIDEAHITTLSVSPDFQRQGIGEKMAVNLLLEAQERGMKCATLEVRAGNQAAICLYKKLGFEPVAIRKKYYPNDHSDAIVMWLYDLDSWTAPNAH